MPESWYRAGVTCVFSSDHNSFGQLPSPDTAKQLGLLRPRPEFPHSQLASTTSTLDSSLEQATTHHAPPTTPTHPLTVAKARDAHPLMPVPGPHSLGEPGQHNPIACDGNPQSTASDPWALPKVQPSLLHPWINPTAPPLPPPPAKRQKPTLNVTPMTSKPTIALPPSHHTPLSPSLPTPHPATPKTHSAQSTPTSPHTTHTAPTAPASPTHHTHISSTNSATASPSRSQVTRLPFPLNTLPTATIVRLEDLPSKPPSFPWQQLLELSQQKRQQHQQRQQPSPNPQPPALHPLHSTPFPPTLLSLSQRPSIPCPPPRSPSPEGPTEHPPTAHDVPQYPQHPPPDDLGSSWNGRGSTYPLHQRLLSSPPAAVAIAAASTSMASPRRHRLAPVWHTSATATASTERAPTRSPRLAATTERSHKLLAQHPTPTSAGATSAAPTSADTSTTHTTTASLTPDDETPPPFPPGLSAYSRLRLTQLWHQHRQQSKLANPTTAGPPSLQPTDSPTHSPPPSPILGKRKHPDPPSPHSLPPPESPHWATAPVHELLAAAAFYGPAFLFHRHNSTRVRALPIGPAIISAANASIARFDEFHGVFCALVQEAHDTLPAPAPAPSPSPHPSPRDPTPRPLPSLASEPLTHLTLDSPHPAHLHPHPHQPPPFHPNEPIPHDSMYPTLPNSTPFAQPHDLPCYPHHAPPPQADQPHSQLAGPLCSLPTPLASTPLPWFSSTPFSEAALALTATGSFWDTDDLEALLPQHSL